MRALPPYPGGGDRPACDWCGFAMRRIGGVETGLLVGHASVWLCWRQDCGHEREIFDSTLPLDYWRAELGFLLFTYAIQRTYADREARWLELFQAFGLTKARELLASGSTVGG